MVNFTKTTGEPAGKSSCDEFGSVQRQPCLALNVFPGKTWTYTVSTMPSAAGVAAAAAVRVGVVGATVVNEGFLAGGAAAQLARIRHGTSAATAISFLVISLHLGFVPFT
ncbi:hypothetical protein [Leifsonia sp. SIMBA_070]|uniref:hypothetical protein n=1 Tax=Leifsonia sp. SIMBA_070 TaxID=3085810 RepID=UPI00397C8138